MSLTNLELDFYETIIMMNEDNICLSISLNYYKRIQNYLLFHLAIFQHRF